MSSLLENPVTAVGVSVFDKYLARLWGSLSEAQKCKAYSLKLALRNVAKYIRSKPFLKKYFKALAAANFLVFGILCMLVLNKQRHPQFDGGTNQSPSESSSGDLYIRVPDPGKIASDLPLIDRATDSSKLLAATSEDGLVSWWNSLSDAEKDRAYAAAMLLKKSTGYLSSKSFLEHSS